MILEWLIELLGAFVRVTLHSLGVLVPPAPDWVYTGFNTAGQVWALLDTFSTWLPVTLAVTVVGAVIAALMVFYTLTLVRMILSYLTLGGGAT